MIDLTELPRGGGVYGIWAPDRSCIYIGSTNDFGVRLLTHRPAVLLGCHIELALSLPDSTRRERHQWEDRAILAMRRAGVRVVNPTNEENHKAHMRFTAEQYREHAAMGLGRLTHKQRVENGRAGAKALTKAQRQAARAKLTTDQLRKAQASLTREQLRAAGRKGAAARWGKDTPNKPNRKRG